jgi:hypothetical protein
MNIYVFVGPSLSIRDARDVLDVHYLPPVAMGDIARLMARRPEAIGIIDGVFETVPAVWHKEILFALSQGVPVYGASSMGALRAAELDTFGMTGVGNIFEQYRDGILEDDDEVAVAHAKAEHGYRSLSDPLVNIREGLRLARSQELISRESAELLLRSAKAKFYPDRTWSDLLATGKDLGVPIDEMAALATAFPKAPNLKREDALRMLERMRDDFKDGIVRHVPSFDFEPTYYWNGLAAFEAAAHTPHSTDTQCVSVGSLGRHVRLNREDRPELLRRALGSFLLYQEAKRCGLIPRRLGDEVDPTPLAGIGRALPVGSERFPQMLDRLGDELVMTLRSRLDFFLAVELARDGELPGILDEIRSKTNALDKRGLSQPKLSEVGIDLRILSNWYQERFGKIDVSGDAHADELNFASWEEFISEVIAEYVVHAPVVS